MTYSDFPEATEVQWEIFHDSELRSPILVKLSGRQVAVQARVTDSMDMHGGGKRLKKGGRDSGKVVGSFPKNTSSDLGRQSLELSRSNAAVSAASKVFVGRRAAVLWPLLRSWYCARVVCALPQNRFILAYDPDDESRSANVKVGDAGRFSMHVSSITGGQELEVVALHFLRCTNIRSMLWLESRGPSSSIPQATCKTFRVDFTDFGQSVATVPTSQAGTEGHRPPKPGIVGRLQGLQLEEALGMKLGHNVKHNAVVVIQVYPGGMAAAQGVCSGWLLMAVNRRSVSTLQEIVDLLSSREKYEKSNKNSEEDEGGGARRSGLVLDCLFCCSPPLDTASCGF